VPVDRHDAPSTAALERDGLRTDAIARAMFSGAAGSGGTVDAARTAGWVWQAVVRQAVRIHRGYERSGATRGRVAQFSLRAAVDRVVGQGDVAALRRTLFVAAPYAHPVAVLAFSRRLWPVGLVVGSLAPDLGYLVGVPASWPCPRGHPRRSWCSPSSSAPPHVAWDGLTHMRGWPATLYADRAVAGVALPLLLRQWSSYAAAIVLLVFLRRTVPARSTQKWNVRWDDWLTLAVLVTAMVLTSALTEGTRWNATVHTLRVGFGVLTAYLVSKRCRARSTTNAAIVRES
jgi:hypothetical protein